MNEEFSKGYTLILQPGVPISSTFAGHYDLAIYLVFILSILAAIFTFIKSKFQFIALSVLFTGELWLLLQTGLRTATLSAFVSVSLILLLKKRFKLVLLFLLVFIVLVANTPRLTGRFDSLFRVIKFKSLISLEQLTVRPVLAVTQISPTPVVLRPIQQDRSSSIRFDVEWPRALRAFYKNPFLGTGFSSITLATDNDYLRSLGETGLLGFLSFAAILIAILKKILKTPTSLFDLSYLGIFTAMLIVATFIDVFEASKVASLFWIFTGLYFGSQKS